MNELVNLLMEIQDIQNFVEYCKIQSIRRVN